MLHFPRWFRLSLLLLAATAAAQTPSPPPAHPPTSECEILAHLPVALLDYSALATGNTSTQLDPAEFKTVLSQLDASLKLAFAAAHGDQQLAEDGWAEATLLFISQTKAGDFGKSPMKTALSLCGLGRSLLVVQQSPLAARFQDRIEALKPDLAKAMRWLGGQRARMQWEDRAAPERLFAEAEAFLLCGRLLGDEALLKFGHEFLDKGMKLHRPSDGVFLEGNSADVSREAASLVRLQEIVLYFPDHAIDQIVAQGAQWEMAQIGTDGTVHRDAKKLVFPGSKMLIGPDKPPEVGEITLALLYYQGRTGDATAFAAVERLRQHYAPPH